MADNSSLRTLTRPYLWVASYAVWTLIAFLTAIPLYRFQWMFNRPVSFWSALAVPLVNNLIYANITPLLVAIGLKFPLQRNNWLLRGSLYAGGAIVFTAVHSFVRIMVYPVMDNMMKEAVPVSWNLYQRVFLYDLPEDCFYIYLPIVLATHLWLYYGQARERELQASQLQMRLVEAQLKTLKAQLQPHFLFNTLHSISSLMMVDTRAADKMMAHLSDLLRMSFDTGDSQETTLNHELQFVNGYLEIEKMRLGDRLAVTTAVDPDTLDARVPHLLLQPVVENAIRHGVSRLNTRGEIAIVAKREGDHLTIEVSDNGPGIGGPNGNEGRGIGLGATRERLHGLYGDSGRISVQSTPYRCTTVVIKLPFNGLAAPNPTALETVHGLL